MAPPFSIYDFFCGENFQSNDHLKDREMGDERVICCDRGSNAGFAEGMNIGANMGNNQNSWLPAMMMNGGANGMWNNPFVYLVWMMFAGRFFNNGNGWDGNGGGQAQQNIELQNEIQSLRSQMQDNQNSNLIMQAVNGNDAAINQLAQNLNCNFGALQGAVCDVRSGIEKLAGQVGFSAQNVINAVTLGNANMTQALQSCCCQTQKSILEMGYQNQLQNCQQTNAIQNAINAVGTAAQQGFNNISSQMQQGFCQVGYNTQAQTCSIINAGNANTQRIIDTLNTHWGLETSQKLQDAKFEISQLKQTQAITQAINGGCGCSTTCGCN